MGDEKLHDLDRLKAFTGTEKYNNKTKHKYSSKVYCWPNGLLFFLVKGKIKASILIKKMSHCYSSAIFAK